MKKWKLTFENGVYKIENEGGRDFVYLPNSGIQILEIDGYAFLDINENGVLDDFEDWREEENNFFTLKNLALLAR